MKKVVVIFALVVAFLLPQSVSAYTITSGANWGPYQTGSGGEFTLTAGDGLQLLLGIYTEDTSLATSKFQTFCVENSPSPFTENILLNRTYQAALNDEAVYGGVGPVGDPVSKGTAYLYFQFVTGNLSGYNYNGTEAQRELSAGYLQNTIWMLEGENYSIAAGNPYPGLVAGISGYTNDNYDATTGLRAYPVFVANLTIGSQRYQDVLVVATPIPGAIWLLGSGLLGLVAVRRRRK